MKKIKTLDEQQLILSERKDDIRISNLARFLLKHIGTKKGALLDVGAGNGALLKFFKSKGFEVEGIEMSQKLFISLKKDLDLKSVKISQGDITQLRGSGEYDYVFACDVIEHISDDNLALRNLFSFVKPGGLLIITVPAHQYLFSKRDELLGHYRRYNKRLLLPKANKLKGKVELCTYWNVLGFLAAYVAKKFFKSPVNEGFRYKDNSLAKAIRFFINLELRIEEFVGLLPLGLTLVCIMRKET